MTDKVQKIRKGIEKLKSQLLRGACSSQVAMETRCKEDAYNDVLALLDTMQASTSWIDKLKTKLDSLSKENFKQVRKKHETEEKEEPVSNELEEAAKHYLYSNILYDDVYVGNPTDKDCIEMFKAGAEWQKEQDYFKIIYPRIITEGTIEQYAHQVAYDMSNDWAIDNPTWNDVQNACKLGAKWQKQQMMKDAIEAEIINWASMFTSIKVIEPERAEAMIKEKFDIGDKVKLIIVKEE